MRLALLLLLLTPAASAQSWAPALTPDGLAEPLHGTWASRGYGWVLSIGADSLAVYDVGEAGCMRDEITAEALVESAGVYRFDGDALVVALRPQNSTRYTLDRLTALPDACAGPPEDSPLYEHPLAFGRRSESDDAHDAGIESSGDAFDYPPFPAASRPSKTTQIFRSSSLIQY